VGRLYAAQLQNGKREPISHTISPAKFLLNFIKDDRLLASGYEEREEFFGRVALSIHLDRVDPKCFLTFSSGLSSADHKPHSPAPGNGVFT
jgi:hypothetical protein